MQITPKRHIYQHGTRLVRRGLEGSSSSGTFSMTIPAIIIIIIITVNPLAARVTGAPQMTLQPVFSISPVLHCPLGLTELQACPFPGVEFPPLPLPALSSSPLSLCLARWFWPDLMNGKHDHTTAVCVSLRSSGGLRMVQVTVCKSRTGSVSHKRTHKR